MAAGLGQTDRMETMLEAVARLQALGYDLELRAAPGGRLHCPACDSAADASNTVVDETVRFEGDSNPEDESVLVALTLPCRHRGLYSAAFGTAAPPDDVTVLHALSAR